jgi:hypothetical protein
LKTSKLDKWIVGPMPSRLFEKVEGRESRSIAPSRRQEDKSFEECQLRGELRRFKGSDIVL